MENFLQTELPAIVWASLLAVVLGLYALKGGKSRNVSRGTLLGVLVGLATLARVLVALVLIIAGVGSFFVGRKLQEFPILQGRDPVGVVQVWWTRGDTATMLNISRTDDPLTQNDDLVQIPGVTWGVRTEVINWPTWGATLGLRPIYRLKDLVAWSPGQPPREVFARPMPHSNLSSWNQILTYARHVPGFPPVQHLMTRQVTAAENVIYRMVMTSEGLEINEENTRPAPLLPTAPGEQT
ncbi:MAG: hypothetical protein MUE60_06770 [Candidatus Eisenbacteria bacterium]|nr:hypothetical protein [Candidatus Eisenbacteria bacterium]